MAGQGWYYAGQLVTITRMHAGVPTLNGQTLGSENSTASSAAGRRHELGQFLTPTPIANFMASLFETHWRRVDLLDAGAGAGALSAAFVRRQCISRHKPRRISITAYELDATLIGTLQETLNGCRRECERAGIQFSATVLNEDFINAAVPMVRSDLFGSHQPRFNAAIVNPPYRKIRSDSATRLLLRSADIETGNLYTGFMALIMKLLANDGEMVAITPRSFCNGPYFKPFRMDFLAAMSLRRLHVFESRSAAFRKDNILQENIIIQAVKSPSKPERVIISSSSGETNGVITERKAAYHEVVSPNDPEWFVHLASEDGGARVRAMMHRHSTSLAELGLSVSTGRVVDFRAGNFSAVNRAMIRRR